MYAEDDTEDERHYQQQQQQSDVRCSRASTIRSTRYVSEGFVQYSQPSLNGTTYTDERYIPCLIVLRPTQTLAGSSSLFHAWLFLLTSFFEFIHVWMPIFFLSFLFFSFPFKSLFCMFSVFIFNNENCMLSFVKSVLEWYFYEITWVENAKACVWDFILLNFFNNGSFSIFYAKIINRRNF